MQGVGGGRGLEMLLGGLLALLAADAGQAVHDAAPQETNPRHRVERLEQGRPADASAGRFELAGLVKLEAGWSETAWSSGLLALSLGVAWTRELADSNTLRDAAVLQLALSF